MNKRRIFILMFILTSKLIYAQPERTRTLDFYFKFIDSIEVVEMQKAGVLNEKDSIADNYLEKGIYRLNGKGFEIYAEIKANIYKSYFSDYLYLQSIDFNDDIYVLYFSVAGFDDVEFQIVKWHKKDWQESYKLSKTLIDKPNQNFQKVAFNYDEGPKNLENVNMFLKNDYLILERGGLFHTLYDLRNNELLINEESPWHVANANDPEGLNKWIKDNIHSKIEQKINVVR